MISDMEKNRGRRIQVLGTGGVASRSRWHLHRNLPRESVSVSHWRKECQGERTAHVGALGGRGCMSVGFKAQQGVSKRGARTEISRECGAATGIARSGSYPEWNESLSRLLNRRGRDLKGQTAADNRRARETEGPVRRLWWGDGEDGRWGLSQALLKENVAHRLGMRHERQRGPWTSNFMEVGDWVQGSWGMKPVFMYPYPELIKVVGGPKALSGKGVPLQEREQIHCCDFVSLNLHNFLSISQSRLCSELLSELASGWSQLITEPRRLLQYQWNKAM